MKKLILVLAIVIYSQSEIFSQGCLPDGIIFTTQAQIDSFQINYPGCSIIEGNVRIEGVDISNLDSLITITTIQGRLKIGNFVNFNLMLSDLTGLSNLVEVGEQLEIQNNTILTSLEGLNNLVSFPEPTFIINNSSLESIASLSNLSSSGSLAIWIDNNESLSNLTGLENITSANNITIRNNVNLVSLTGLENINDVEDLYIIGNTILENFIDFNNLTTVRWISIADNSALTSISGLNNLTSVTRDLIIENNPLLSSLTPLVNVSSIGGMLSIEGNASLSTLNGLESVTTIGASPFEDGNLIIANNAGLINVSGLENIEASSINDLTIVDNSTLSECDVQSICDYLASPNGTVEISNNATGCNSPEEVEVACLVGIDELSDVSFTLYPNPASNELFITSENNIPINEIIIFNQLGQNVLHQYMVNNSIDVSMLQSGIYVIELVSGSSKYRKKLIIE
jgi:hypothetical protein